MVRVRKKNEENRKTRPKMSGPWKILESGSSYVRVIPWSGQYKRRYIREFKNVRSNIPLFETYRVRKSDIKMIPKSLYYLYDVQGKKLLKHFFEGLEKIRPVQYCSYDPTGAVPVTDRDIPCLLYTSPSPRDS